LTTEEKLNIDSEEAEIEQKNDNQYTVKILKDTVINVYWEEKLKNKAEDVQTDMEETQKPEEKKEEKKNNASEEQEKAANSDDENMAYEDLNKKEKKIVENAIDSVYLLKHLNPKYVSEINSAGIGDPVTYARAAAAYTIKGGDELEDGKQGRNIIASVNYTIAIYDVDPDSKYYVCIANSNLGKEEPYTTDVIYNNKLSLDLEGKKEITDPAGTVYLSTGSVNSFAPLLDDEGNVPPVGELAAFTYLKEEEPLYTLLDFTADTLTINSYAVDDSENIYSLTISKTDKDGGHTYKNTKWYMKGFTYFVSVIVNIINNYDMYKRYKEQGFDVSVYECLIGS
jgi:hypothetical protein